MVPFERFRADVIKILAKNVSASKPDISRILEHPPEGIGADLAFPCFFLSAKHKKDPKILAGEIADKLKKEKPAKLIKSIQTAGPYVNFIADWDQLNSLVLEDIFMSKGDYGRGANKKTRVMTEYSHPNTHKSFHIGHVRNICIGESISRILEFSGHRVVRANYQGDIGPHVARTIWGFINLYKKKAPRDKDKGLWLGEVYARASDAVRDNEAKQEEVREINNKLYSADKEITEIWKKTRKWSLDYYDDIYKDFWARFDRLYFESEAEKPGKKAALELLNKGKAKKSEGAVVMDFEKEGLGIFVLLTGDGNPLYGAKDLGLARMQVKEYNPDHILHITGSEQNMYFRQLFRTLEFLEPSIAKKEKHICYELVNLPTGKMSSRQGSVITYNELKAKLVKLARKTTSEKNPSLNGKKLEKTAELVALGALKYGMLNVSPEKVIVFDWDRALRFEGNSAPYIQYSHARARSILRKADIKPSTKLADKSPRAEALLKHLASFPEAVERAGRDLKPHYITNYAYELATRFNDFYEKCPVLTAKLRDIRAARLALVQAASIVMKSSLDLLGIEAPEEM